MRPWVSFFLGILQVQLCHCISNPRKYDIDARFPFLFPEEVEVPRTDKCGSMVNFELLGSGKW